MVRAKYKRNFGDPIDDFGTPLGRGREGVRREKNILKGSKGDNKIFF